MRVCDFSLPECIKRIAPQRWTVKGAKKMNVSPFVALCVYDFMSFSDCRSSAKKNKSSKVSPVYCPAFSYFSILLAQGIKC
jgi:hypothetical protein